MAGTPLELSDQEVTTLLKKQAFIQTFLPRAVFFHTLVGTLCVLFPVTHKIVSIPAQWPPLHPWLDTPLLILGIILLAIAFSCRKLSTNNPIESDLWKIFFIIKNDSVFWVRQELWPKDIDLIQEYFEKVHQYYQAEYGDSFLNEDEMKHTLGRIHVPKAIDDLLDLFLAEYGGDDIIKAVPGFHQFGLIIITVECKDDCNIKRFPWYFKGIQVKPYISSTVDLSFDA